MTTAVYEQATGLLCVNTPLPFRGVGYAGTGPGRNNPDKQSFRNVGPIPRGWWSVLGPFDHPTKGPVCFRLEPMAGTVTFGRSAFMIHGDNSQGDASHGCIVMPRPIREAIAKAKVTKLQVVSLFDLVNAASKAA